jgi:hypothetical protein
MMGFAHMSGRSEGVVQSSWEGIKATGTALAGKRRASVELTKKLAENGSEVLADLQDCLFVCLGAGHYIN